MFYQHLNECVKLVVYHLASEKYANRELRHLRYQIQVSLQWLNNSCLKETHNESRASTTVWNVLAESSLKDNKDTFITRGL